MVALFNRGGQAQDGGDAGSLRERFRAWWDGEEILEPLAEPVPDADAKAELEHPEQDDAPREYWEAARVKLVQDIWGQGFASPGGRDYILSRVTIFALDPAMTVLDLGAGLGGAARIMCEKFGVWVTGFEADAALAEAAMALSVKAGMSEKVPINVFDPKVFEHKAKSVDCVFSKEFLFTVANKPKFLKAVERLLKLKGQFLFTDYVLAKPHLKTPVLKEWIAHEPLKPYPWAIEDYHDALTGLHLDIRVTEDVTEDFRAMVIKGWTDYIQSTRRGRLSADSARVLVDEVERWTRRMQAIDSGDLKVCRMHVFKKDSEKMMSDW
jgi:cyclopropane fatty-acyl-phospholipid synthase-like methyltransferase